MNVREAEVKNAIDRTTPTHAHTDCGPECARCFIGRYADLPNAVWEYAPPDTWAGKRVAKCSDKVVTHWALCPEEAGASAMPALYLRDYDGPETDEQWDELLLTATCEVFVLRFCPTCGDPCAADGRCWKDKCYDVAKGVL